MWRKAGFIVFFVLTISCYAQDSSLVIIEGTVVAYTPQSAFYPKKGVVYMDYFPRYVFFFRNAGSCGSLKRSGIFKLYEKINQAVFFYNDCPLQFDFYFEKWGIDTARLQPLDQQFYPTKTDFTFKEDGILFKCSSVKIKCKFLLLPVEVVRSSTRYNLNFSMNMIPSFFVYEIEKLD